MYSATAEQFLDGLEIWSEMKGLILAHESRAV